MDDISGFIIDLPYEGDEDRYCFFRVVIGLARIVSR